MLSPGSHIDDRYEIIDALAAAGSTWSVLVPGGPPDRLDVIAEEVLPEPGSSA